MGELSLSTSYKSAALPASLNPAAVPAFHLRYAGKEPILSSKQPTIVDVNLFI